MLSKKLEQYRKLRGLSQADLARMSNVPQSAISEIEAGSRMNPGIQTIANLAAILNVSIEDLIGQNINTPDPAA